MQVLPLAQDYLAHPEKLQGVWVYDDGFVKGMLHVEGRELKELYVDTFFEGQGIGGKLIEFGVRSCGVDYLFVLEKNRRAIAFYESHGFFLTKERKLEPGTTEYIVQMERKQQAVSACPCGNCRDMLE